MSREKIVKTAPQRPEVWDGKYSFSFEYSKSSVTKSRSKTVPFASATASLSEGVLSNSMPSQAACPPAPPPPNKPKVELKPATDVLAGAVARAASQGTIHPLDTLKVRLQTRGGKGLQPPAAHTSKFSKLLPPAGASPDMLGKGMSKGFKSFAGLYKGVLGAATGAGIYIGTYFAFYGATCNLLSKHTNLSPGAVAFVGGGIAAAGGSVVKVPLAVCIRSVQAGVYKNALHAASSIIAATGPRGLFTGFLPTIIEDIPDMAFKFAAYETLRSLHKQIYKRNASAQEDFVMGAISGAFAAAATTPLDVIKTRMMCSAASKPSMGTAARNILSTGGPRAFFRLQRKGASLEEALSGALRRGVAPRAISDGINSAVFFCFFEMLRAAFKRRREAAQRASIQQAADAERAGNLLLSGSRRSRHAVATPSLQSASITTLVALKPGKGSGCQA